MLGLAPTAGFLNHALKIMTFELPQLSLHLLWTVPVVWRWLLALVFFLRRRALRDGRAPKPTMRLRARVVTSERDELPATATMAGMVSPQSLVLGRTFATEQVQRCADLDGHLVLLAMRRKPVQAGDDPG